MRSAIIILSGWRFLSAFLRKKSPLGVFSRADPELSSYPFWLKLKMLSHPIWGYLSEYFRHLLSFSDSFLKTAYVAVWTLLAGCVIWVMGTFSLFSKTATWSGGIQAFVMDSKSQTVHSDVQEAGTSLLAYH